MDPHDTTRPNTKACKQCGVSFHVKPSHYDEYTYCSATCRKEGRAAHHAELYPQRICPVCGVVFQSKKERTQIYCSRQCVGRAVGIQSELRIHNPPLKTTCKHCGKDIETYHRDIQFCSKACSTKGKQKPMRNTGSRRDSNHHEIIEALQAIGAGIIDTSSLGNGFPDLIVGFRGVIHLLEIKNNKTAYGRKGLNPNQVRFHQEWQGTTIHVVYNVLEAYSAIGADVEMP